MGTWSDSDEILPVPIPKVMTKNEKQQLKKRNKKRQGEGKEIYISQKQGLHKTIRTEIRNQEQRNWKFHTAVIQIIASPGNIVASSKREGMSLNLSRKRANFIPQRERGREGGSRGFKPQ